MRRPPLLVVLVAGVVALAGCGGASEGSTAVGSNGTSTGELASATPTPTPKELPEGGRRIFPKYRLVGYSGVIGSGPGLGRAGVGDIDDRMTELVQRSPGYATDGRTTMPVLEYIATVVQPCSRAPQCRTVSPEAKTQQHLDAVRKVHGLLLLAIQPGRSDFLTEVKKYEKFLKEPDVGVALDPEWRMGPQENPGQTFGSTDAAELNATADYLAKLVADNDLPEKVMLYHMIRTNWVRNHETLTPHQGLATILSVDGIGSQSMKTETWTALMQVKPAFVHAGFKLFYDEDTAHKGWALMTPTQVLALTPTPEYVLYE